MPFAVSILFLAALLAALPQPEHPFLRNFAATGTVTAAAENGNFILETAKRPVFIFNRLPTAPRPGEVIAARGYVERGLDRRENPCLQEFTVLGVTNPPPPIACTIADINDEKLYFRNVTAAGTLVDVIRDEIDPKYLHGILKDGSDILRFSIFAADAAAHSNTLRLINALVQVTGVCTPNLGASRAYAGPSIGLIGESKISILKPPPNDPFDVPELECAAYISPRKVMRMGRRSVRGLVTAAWDGNRFLLRTTDGRDVQITLAQTAALPPVGHCVCAVGHPDTDLYHLNLIYAEWRPCDRLTVTSDPLQDVRVQTIFRDAAGRPKFNTRLHGKLLRICGIVRRLSTDENLFVLESDSFLVSIRTPTPPTQLAVGAQVEATGICLMEAESWRPNLILPQIKSVQLITRTPDDIRVLAHPPWWTPGRLIAVILTLLALLIGILIWNRILNRLVERRSRLLFRAQIARSSSELKVDERTRLAVELHDALSQKLAGVAYQVASLRNVLTRNPSVAAARLQTAEQMLASCRTELRHCLFDLRSDSLDAKDLATAIRSCLGELKVSVPVDIDFPIDRQRLHDATAHAILCIIRELVSNALRHGAATAIAVKGRLHDGLLTFSVRDNGRGFDTTNHLGVPDGHFGLFGIGERLKRLGGTFKIDSKPGAGTTALCEIPTVQSDRGNLP